MSGTLSDLDLLEAARNGDSRACEQVLEENNGLIWSVVRRYYGRGVEPDDLYQLGCLGFLKAVRGFDQSYGTQFSTYAVPKIAGEIRRFLRDDGPVKVSRGLKERGMSVRNARSKLSTNWAGSQPCLNWPRTPGCLRRRLPRRRPRRNLLSPFRRKPEMGD